MTPQEAEELGWCAKAGCTCDATFHIPPGGTPGATAEDLAAIDAQARPLLCKCKAFRFGKWAPWAAQQRIAHTQERCGYFVTLTIAWVGDTPAFSVTWLESRRE